nr:hypothetical protein [Micromonospora sp. RTP1Z1]
MYSIVVQASFGIEEIAVLTLASKRTVTETSAPDLSAAAEAQRNDLPYGRAERGRSVHLIMADARAGIIFVWQQTIPNHPRRRSTLVR